MNGVASVKAWPMPVDATEKSQLPGMPSATLLRYTIVSGVAFAVDLGLLLALSGSMPLLVANSVAFILANIAHFAVAHTWVFGKKLNDPRLLSIYAVVAAISVVGLLINDLVVWLGVVMLGSGLIAAKILATLVAWAWNYQARRRWVYTERRP
jgi:putative flippase GtrA